MNYSSGTQREAIGRRSVLFYKHFFLPFYHLLFIYFFSSLTQVFFQFLLAVPIKCSNQRAGVGDYREGWVCSRTSFKCEPDCTGSSGMSWLVMSWSITCSTSPFAILSTPLSHLLFFVDLSLYCRVLTNGALSQCTFVLVGAAVICWPSPGEDGEC